MPIAARPGEESLALGPVARRVRRLVLATQGGPLRVVWRLAYAIVARGFLAHLTRGHRRAAGYLIGGLGDRDAVYGNSDVDAVVVLGGDPPQEELDRVHARWEALVERLPFTRLMLDDPQVYSEEQLRRATGSLLTYEGPSWAGPGFRLLVRPGLHGPGERWRRVTGPEYRPRLPQPDRQEQRVAAWLELQRWWREAFPLCVRPEHPLAADICVKLAAEPARVWLWLEHGERVDDRHSALIRAAELLPEEAPGLHALAEMRTRPARTRHPPLAQALRLLVALSEAVAGTIRRETEDATFTEVRLDGAADELVLPDGGLASDPDAALLPLCDWPALVSRDLPDTAVAALAGSPADPAVLGDAARFATQGALPVLRSGSLAVMPTTDWTRGLIRAVSSALTDPVTFALLSGESAARFPELTGWAAGDWARRANTEHLARRAPGGGKGLGRAIAGARAGLFLESVEAGEPRLALTCEATLRALSHTGVDRSLLDEAREAYARFAERGEQPPARLVSAFTSAVAGGVTSRA